MFCAFVMFVRVLLFGLSRVHNLCVGCFLFVYGVLLLFMRDVVWLLFWCVCLCLFGL